jgi:DNA-binding NtrC family response regulator
LFGHITGSFTGATTDKIGKFTQAHGGTIFLDEIGTASLGMQVKMLRVLQEFEFEPVGSTKTQHVDVRVILATNDNLSQAVADGRFRQDLFYRVNVINLEIPSLRDRLSDIPMLASHFLKRVSEEAGKLVEGFTPDAIAALQRHNWPGNVRELQNVIERAVLLGKGNYVTAEDFPSHLAAHAPSTVPTKQGRLTLKEALEGPERQIILQTLKEFQWNRNVTADALGINRTTLYKKMKRLGLEEMEAAQSRA